MTLTDLEQQIAPVLAQLEAAWNAGDAVAFAACFTSDARLVAANGDYIVGRGAITDRHAQLFATLFAGSRNEFTLITATDLAPTIAVANARSTLQAPGGPLAGSHPAVLTLVLVQRMGAWQIAALQNTWVGEPWH